MNTKTDGISSGLVAFCYMSDQYEVALFSEPPTDPLYDDMFPVVRLSDAEAIISDLQTLVIAENQRKQQLEEQVAKQSAALKLARAALTDWLTTDLDEQQCYEALAAIDALGENNG